MPIPLAIPLIMSAIGVGAKGLSAIKGGQHMAEADQSLQDEKAGLKAWYETETNKDFMESDVTRSALSKVLENIESQNKQSESAGAITGATDAAKIATKAKTQQQYGDTVKSLASYGTQRRDRLDTNYRSDLSRLMGVERGIATGKAQNTAKLGDVAGQLLGGAAPLFGQTKWGDTTTADATSKLGEN